MTRQPAVGERDHIQSNAFTLVELLVAIAIIGVLASLSLFALYGVQEDVRQTRTRSIVLKIDEVLSDKWQSYQQKPIRFNRAADPLNLSQPQLRLAAVRALLRMEFPERKSDLLDGGPIAPNGPLLASATAPSSQAQRTYWQLASKAIMARYNLNPTVIANQIAWQNDARWTPRYENAECLYLIVAASRVEDGPALKLFKETEIGDVDNDGMLEILDSWGRPIRFLRWAPALIEDPGADNSWGDAGVDDDADGVIDNLSEAGWPNTDDRPSPSNAQSVKIADSFDPLRASTRWKPPTGSEWQTLLQPFDLVPIVYSAGSDGKYGIRYVPTASLDTTDPEQGGDRQPNAADFRYGQIAWPNTNDPYFLVTSGDPVLNPHPFEIGSPLVSWTDVADNLTNHLIDTE